MLTALKGVQRLAAKTDPQLLLLLLMSLFVWAPMLNSAFFFNAHDARHSVFYVVEFDQALKDGAWYPRWGTDFALGYGYPLFDVYAPLSIYVSEFFHLVGLGYVEAVKATFALGWVFSSFAMYGFARRLFGAQGGLLAAVVYTFVPYRIVDVYVRGSLAESFAFVFVPLVLWSFGELASGGHLSAMWREDGNPAPDRRVNWRQVAFAGSSLAGLVLTHNGMALICAPLVLAYCLWLLVVRWIRDPLASPHPNALPLGEGIGMLPLPSRERAGVRASWLWRRIHPHPNPLPRGEGIGTLPLSLEQGWGEGENAAVSFMRRVRAERASLTGLIAAGLLALGLSAIFWLPMVVESKYVQVEQWTAAAYDFSSHFLYFFQLFSPFWGYGYSGVGIKDDMPFQLGVAAVIIVIFALVAALRRRPAGHQRRHAVFFLGATALAIFTMLGASAFLWNHVPAASLVQFPWRLLALTSVTTAVLAGALLPWPASMTSARSRVLALSPLLALVLLASYSYLVPQYTPVAPENISPRAVIDFETFSPRDRVGATRWVTEQPTTSPLVPEYLAGEPLQKAKAADERAQVEQIHHGGQSEEIRVNTPAPTEVVFYTYYFPGWSAQVDGIAVDIYPSTPQGLITLRVPAGEHRVSIRFGGTLVRRVGTGISVVSVVGLVLLNAGLDWRRIGGMIWKRRRKKATPSSGSQRPA